MGDNWSGNGSVEAQHFKIGCYGLWDRVGEMNCNQAILLADIVSRDRKIDSLTAAERETWRGIEGRFAHALADGTVICDIAVFENGAREKLYAILRAHPQYDVLLASYQQAFDDVMNILRGIHNSVLQEQLTYCTSILSLNTRMMAVNDAIEAGRLIVPERPETSTIGIVVEIQ